MKQIFKISFALALVLGFSSCDMNLRPYSVIDPDNALESYADAQKLANGFNNQIRSLAVGSKIYGPELQSDLFHAVADFGSVKLSELTNYCDVYLNDIDAVEWAVFGQKEGSSDWVEIIGFTSSKNANRYSKTDRYKDLEKSYTDPVTGEKQVSVHKTVKGSVFILEVVYEK